MLLSIQYGVLSMLWLTRVRIVDLFFFKLSSIFLFQKQQTNLVWTFLDTGQERERWSVFVRTAIVTWRHRGSLHIWKSAWEWEGIAVEQQAGGTWRRYQLAIPKLPQTSGNSELDNAPWDYFRGRKQQAVPQNSPIVNIAIPRRNGEQTVCTSRYRGHVG